MTNTKTTFEDRLREKAAKMFSQADYFILTDEVSVYGVLPLSGAGITLKPGIYSNWRHYEFE